MFTVLESRGPLHPNARHRQDNGGRNRGRAREVACQVAITSDNYDFGAVREDGDAFVVETVARRQDELLFKGRMWITRNGYHLKRIEGEPAKTPSFWTSGIHFVSDFQPVNGVWMQVRTRPG